MTSPRFVIVTGLSGAGKSQAMKSFEDLGFYCLDNLPPKLAGTIVEFAESAHLDRVALALDVRTHGPFGDPLEALAELERRGVSYELLFLDATDEVLVRRYSETRRRHPFGGARHLTDAIAVERASLSALRHRADRVWDTSAFNHATLKAKIGQAYALATGGRRLSVVVLAFGFKYGLPLDADLVLDVRFLPNPNYIPALKPLTGSDPAVAQYLERMPATEQFLERVNGLIDFLLPQYEQEGKSHLTIAVGCTGGRHRSVYIARQLFAHLRARDGLTLALECRDVGR